MDFKQENTIVEIEKNSEDFVLRKEEEEKLKDMISNQNTITKEEIQE